jgi:hypothetical protein
VDEEVGASTSTAQPPPPLVRTQAQALPEIRDHLPGSLLLLAWCYCYALARKTWRVVGEEGAGACWMCSLLADFFLNESDRRAAGYIKKKISLK